MQSVQLGVILLLSLVQSGLAGPICSEPTTILSTVPENVLAPNTPSWALIARRFGRTFVDPAETVPKVMHRVFICEMEQQKCDLMMGAPASRATRMENPVGEELYASAHTEQCKKLNPGWTVRDWDKEQVDKFIIEYYSPSFKELYDSLPLTIMRADVARYLIIAVYGGIYLDLDWECRRPFKDILMDGAQLILPQRQGRLANGLLGSVPNHPFWDCLLHHVFEHIQRGGVCSDMLRFEPQGCKIIGTSLTGPKMISHVAKMWGVLETTLAKREGILYDKQQFRVHLIAEKLLFQPLDPCAVMNHKDAASWIVDRQEKLFKDIPT